MRTIQTLQQAGPDKMLRLTIPVDEPGVCYRVLVVLEPQPEAATQPLAPAPGWPADYFARTAGSIEDESFVRPPQGDFEKRMELE
jgi:hypothetical protein